MFRKVQISVSYFFYPLHYSTKFTHQCLLNRPSSILHVYADDTQLFISFSPNSFSDSINHFLLGVKQIFSWMTSNVLCLNPSKTEFILLCLRYQLNKIPDPSISLNLDSASTHTFTPTSPVRNLGVIFDQNLSFSDHSHHSALSLLFHAYPRPSPNSPYARSKNCIYHRYIYSPR